MCRGEDKQAMGAIKAVLHATDVWSVPAGGKVISPNDEFVFDALLPLTFRLANHF